VLSSKGESKHDARFVGRLDVLTERVDTLASTVATTASAIAKKDGEIAALRRDLQARDEALQALAAQARLAAQAPAADTPIDANDLRSLRNAVAALTKERAQGLGNPRLDELAAHVGSLGQRLDALSTMVESVPPAAPDLVVQQRVAVLEASLASLRTHFEQHQPDVDGPSEELRGMLVTLRSQVETLDGLAARVTEERLDARVGETDAALEKLAERVDALDETVRATVAGIDDKEQELSALHLHFTEASARVESVVEDLREALSAFPDPGSTAVDELSQRVDEIEHAVRDASEDRGHGTEELARRIDAIDQRVAVVATEVARAKTLWPVALRSLEARLDDAVSHVRIAEPAADATEESSEADAADSEVPSDDLLAGLRDSLQAMETVAAEMARASDALGEPDRAETPDAPVAAAGATIVPLRSSEP